MVPSRLDKLVMVLEWGTSGHVYLSSTMSIRLKFGSERGEEILQKLFTLSNLRSKFTIMEGKLS
ncbi:hypothetical protein LguiB_021748 [Lonicera macranthoides]